MLKNLGLDPLTHTPVTYMASLPFLGDAATSQATLATPAASSNAKPVALLKAPHLYKGNSSLVHKKKGIEEHILANGLRVVLIPDGGKTLKSSLIVNAGSIHDPKGREGLAHLIEHVISEEFQTTDGQIFDLPSFVTAMLGGYADIETCQTYTKYEVETHFDNFSKLMGIFSHLLNFSEPSDEILEQEKGVVLQEFDEDDSRDTADLLAMRATSFRPESPFARPILGSKDAVKSTSKKDIADFCAKYYVPNNSVLVVSGSFDSNEVLGRIDGALGTIRSAEYAMKPDLPIFVSSEPLEQEFYSDQGAGVEITYNINGELDRDTRLLDVLANLLGPELNEAYPEKLPKIAKKIQEIEVSTATEKDIGLFNISVKTRKSITKRELHEIKDWILKVINKLLKTGKIVDYDGDLLDDNASVRFDLKHGKHRKYTHVEGAETMQIPWYLNFDKYRDIRIRQKEVRDLARRYLKPKGRRVAIYSFKKREEVSSETAPKDLKVDDLSEFKFPDALRPSEDYACNLDSSNVPHFDNFAGEKSEQVRINHRPGAKIVKCRVANKGGRQLLSGEASDLADITQKMLNEVGIKGSSANDLRDEFEKLGATFLFNNKDDEHGLYLHYPVEKSKQVLKLLAKLLNRSKISREVYKGLKPRPLRKLERKLEQVKNEYISELKERILDDSIHDLVAHHLYPQGHPRYKKELKKRIKDIEAIGVEDVVSFYEKNYKLSDQSIVTLVGAYNQEQYQEQLFPVFADWNNNDLGSDHVRDLPETASEEKEIKQKFGSRLAPVIFANAWHLDGDLASVNIQKLIIDYALHTKMTNLLRADRGLVYSVLTMFNDNKSISSNNGDFYMSFEVDPMYKEKAQQLARNALQLFAREGLSQAEFDLCKNYVLNRYKMLLCRESLLDYDDLEQADRLNEDNIDCVDKNERVPALEYVMPLDFDEFSSKVGSLSLDDVNGSIKKMIKPDTMLTVAAA